MVYCLARVICVSASSEEFDVPENWPGMTGDHGLVRISTRLIGGDACPAQRAAKVRPAVWPAQRSRTRKPRLGDFPLRPVMDAIDEVEFRGLAGDEVLDQLAREISLCIPQCGPGGGTRRGCTWMVPR